jgi:hypothetical protein
LTLWNIIKVKLKKRKILSQMSNAEVLPQDENPDYSEPQSEAAARALRRTMHLMPNIPSYSAKPEASRYVSKTYTAEDEVVLNSLTRSLRTLGVISDQMLVIGRKTKNVRPSIPGQRFTGLIVACEIDDPQFRWGGKYVTDVNVNGTLPAQEVIGEATLCSLGAEALTNPCEIVDEEVDPDYWRS